LRVYRAAVCGEGRLGMANEYMGYAFDREGSWGIQEYLAQKRLPPPQGHHRTLDIFLR